MATFESLTANETAWLAGLLEGEGYFGIITSRVGGKAYRYPRVGVCMTDEDVIARVGRFLGIKPYHVKPSGASKLVGFRVTLSGKRAALLMTAVYPLMGDRRRRSIDAVLDEYGHVEDAGVRRRRSCQVAAERRAHRPDGTFAPNEQGRHTAV